jgi:hypothetical protein
MSAIQEGWLEVVAQKQNKAASTLPDKRIQLHRSEALNENYDTITAMRDNNARRFMHANI